jgi:hypothetical protein
MNQTLRTLLAKSIYWNSFESISYQLILCTHQVALFYTLSSEQYGMVGVLFSYLYALGTLSNVGLDTALGSWWAQALQSKANFRRLVIAQLIPQIIIAITLLASFFLLYPLLARFFLLYPLHNSLNYDLLLAVGLLAILESIKKSLKVCMYLLFANYVVAPTEVLLILLYTAITWSFYGMYGMLSLSTIFIPMLFTTSVSIIVYIKHILTCYNRLGHDSVPALSRRQISIIRLGNYITQLTHLIFSGNFLIPLFATRFGLPVAGALKFIDTIAYSLGTIMRKVVGTTGQALFTHSKSMGNTIQTELFASITNQAYQMLYALLIFFIINSTKVNHTTILTIGIGAALLYGLLIITENIFYVYEQFFIAHDKAYYSAFFNGSSFAITYLLLYFTSLSLTTLLILLVLIRMLIMALLEIVARFYWGAKSNIRIQPLYGLSALAIALVVFFMF